MTSARRRLTRTLTTLPVAVTMLAAASGCGTSGNDRAEHPSATTTTTTTTTTTIAIPAGRPYAPVQRPIVEQRTADDGTVRELQTELWLPDRAGPSPLVAFAHGMDGHPRKFHQLFAALAGAGYAVVAPRFPHSADDAHSDLATAVNDVGEQALDLQHIVTRLRAESADPTNDLAGRIDPDRLALAGLSLGGGTVLRAAYTDCCPSLRPAVVIAYSPVPFATTPTPTSPPLWLVHGTDDRTLPYQGSVDLFAAMHQRRWFVTLDGAPHSAPYEDSESAFDELVPATTVDVLDHFVLGDPTALDRAVAAIDDAPNATVRAVEPG